jgi:hypothetical protein
MFPCLRAVSEKEKPETSENKRNESGRQARNIKSPMESRLLLPETNSFPIPFLLAHNINVKEIYTHSTARVNLCSKLA